MATKKPIVLTSGAANEMASTDTLPLSNLGTGTPIASSYLKGDGSWATLAGGDMTSNLGYLNIPQSSNSVNYTLQLSDVGRHLYNNGILSVTWSIPQNLNLQFPIGTSFVFINRGNQSLSIAVNGTDRLIMAATTTEGVRTLAINGLATAIQVEYGIWLISGAGLS